MRCVALEFLSVWRTAPCPHPEVPFSTTPPELQGHSTGWTSLPPEGRPGKQPPPRRQPGGGEGRNDGNALLAALTVPPQGETHRLWPFPAQPTLGADIIKHLTSQATPSSIPAI